MILTKEEVKKGLKEMADENLAKRAAIGVEGDNPEYMILIHALALLD